MQNRKITSIDKIIHEMNGSIHNIGFLSELMLTHKVKFNEEDNKQNLTSINIASSKLAKLVDLLSRITNLKTDRLKIRQAEQDLVTLVEEEIRYQQAWNKINPQVKIELSNKVSTCRAQVDGFWFRQLLSNLIVNAINHTRKGTIRISTETSENNGIKYFSLNVSDEGCGISEDELKNIFKPFERGSHSIGITPGYGIGLAIAKEIVEAHGGNIIARNNNRGGATFKTIIPIRAVCKKHISYVA